MRKDIKEIIMWSVFFISLSVFISSLAYFDYLDNINKYKLEIELSKIKSDRDSELLYTCWKYNVLIEELIEFGIIKGEKKW